jgi:hypothetical protein
VSARGTLDRAMESRALLQLGTTPDRAQRLLAKARVCPDWGHVDEPGECQGGGSGTQGQTVRKAVVLAHESPGTIEGGGHSDDAKPVRQSPRPLGQEGDRHEV